MYFLMIFYGVYKESKSLEHHMQSIWEPVGREIRDPKLESSLECYQG